MVIDTMVFAYALFDAPEFRDESMAVLNTSPSILVPDSFRAEFTNVAWQWMRRMNLPLHIGITALSNADTLVTRVTSSAELWERALTLSVEANHPAYDTLFIALAESADTRVITYDSRLQSSFPEMTLSPSEFLS